MLKKTQGVGKTGVHCPALSGCAVGVVQEIGLRFFVLLMILYSTTRIVAQLFFVVALQKNGV